MTRRNRYETDPKLRVETATKLMGGLVGKLRRTREFVNSLVGLYASEIPGEIEALSENHIMFNKNGRLYEVTHLVPDSGVN